MDKEKLLRTMIIEELLHLDLRCLTDVLLLVLNHKSKSDTDTSGNIPEGLNKQ